MKIISTLLFASALFFLSACVKEDKDCGIPAGSGLIEIRTDWSNRSPEVGIPETLRVLLEHGGASEPQLFTIIGSPAYLPFQKTGLYRMYLYNDADFVTVEGTLATVESSSRSLRANPVIEANPGWFFTASADVTVPEQDTVIVVARMEQQIRKLTFTFHLVDEGPLQLARLAASLDGIAGSFDLATGELGNISSAYSLFDRQGEEETAVFHLLGIIPGVPQALTLLLTYSDNSTKTLIVDISDKLEGFNDNKETPMEWEADLSVDTEAEFSGSIVNWVNKTEDISISNR